MPKDEDKTQSNFLDKLKEKVAQFALGSDAILSYVKKLAIRQSQEKHEELEGVKRDKLDMLAALSKSADKALKKNPNFKKVLAHIFTVANSAPQKKARQEFKEKYGHDSPGFLLVSPTHQCNLRCIGCYAISSSEKQSKLSWGVFDKIMQQKHDLWGSHFTVISGGEPLMYRDQGKGILDMAEKYNDTFFIMYTNGTLITKDVAKRMAELGNITPAISIEGYEEETDCRRGKGTYQKILQAMENQREAGVMFGISITALRNNAEKVVEESFYDHYLNKLGASYAWIFQYMPIGRKQTLDLQVTPQQRLNMWKKTRELVRKGYFVADFWNSACVTSGCISAGKSYFYIDWNGDVSPCAFNPYAPVNINELFKEDKDLNDMAEYPFFKDIRKWQADYSNFGHPKETGNYLIPCAIRDHYKMMRQLIDKHHPKPIDESAAQALEDDSYRHGLEEYDQQLQETMDPVWEEEYLSKD